jgi:hypothetical protein
MMTKLLGHHPRRITPHNVTLSGQYFAIQRSMM